MKNFPEFKFKFLNLFIINLLLNTYTSRGNVINTGNKPPNNITNIPKNILDKLSIVLLAVSIVWFVNLDNSSASTSKPNNNYKNK